jgi:hypothetical protein
LADTDGDGEGDGVGVGVGVADGDALAAAAAEALAAADAQASSDVAGADGLGTERLEPANGFELLGRLGEADGLGLGVGVGVGVGIALAEGLAESRGFTPGQTLGRSSGGLPDADAWTLIIWLRAAAYAVSKSCSWEMIELPRMTASSGVLAVAM